jgi:hypothetical protein
MLNGVMSFIGTVLLAGGGGGAVVFYLFKLFGEKWLNTKFEERLATFKHEHQTEIERLRGTINTLMDRATKLHQREFEVLPEAWGRLNDAFIKISGLPFRFDPNLDVMTEEQLNEFLSKSPLANWEQNELKRATDKTQYYASHIVMHSFTDTLTTYNEYGVYLIKNGIFIESGLRDKFREIDQLMQEALTEQKINVLQQRDQSLAWKWEKIAALDRKGRELIHELEREVQARLWNADAIK